MMPGMNQNKGSFNASTSWLANILHLIFRTQDKRRELIVWLSGDIPCGLLSQIRLLAITDEYPEGLEFEIKGDAEGFTSDDSIFYVLTLKPLKLEQNEVRGRLHATNVEYLQIQLPTGETMIFVHCPKNGFFYPADDITDTAEDLPAKDDQATN
ncbi:MAG: hypothetical protein PHW53_00020 [Patescibacteria group bacterium]|nr:hypothetical protein [Patescibacteria group bacterium]